MGEMDEDIQRKLLLRNGWIPVGETPLGEGGGARVFKVVAKEAATRLIPPLLPNDKTRAQNESINLARTIAEIADGTQQVICAGKVAKEEEHRTKREIEILRDVQHPNLIRMIDADKTTMPRWYVMPVMRGGTLKETGKKFTGNLTGVLQGMIEIASALGALHSHEKAIVHRDVKPGNVFIGDSGEWILGDPGIAYRDDGADATTTRPVSKDWFPRWYDDELGHGPVTDIYMLGAVGFYLLTGQMKPLDPTFLRKPKFDLPMLFPNVPGIREAYELLLSVVTSDPETITHRDGNQLASALKELLPIVTEDPTHKLGRELRRIRTEPRPVYSYAGGERDQDAGGLQRIAVWIPADSEHLIIFINSAHEESYAMVVAQMHDGNLHGESSRLKGKVPNVMQMPPVLRGCWCWLTLIALEGWGTRGIRSFSVHSVATT